MVHRDQVELNCSHKPNPRIRVIFLALAALAGLFACGRPEAPSRGEGPVLVRVENDWPELSDDMDRASLDRAVEQSMIFLRRLPPDRIFQYGSDSYTAAHLLTSLETLAAHYRRLGPGPALAEVLRREFVAYRSTGRDGTGQVLCTGYHEPELSGSPVRTERFRWPLYQLPPDLIEVDLGTFSPELKGRTIKGRREGRQLIPYYSRAQIDGDQVLAGRSLELAWADDPVALFFLHVQGSGRLRLADGSQLMVGYAGGNGRSYRSIGQKMIAEGLLDREAVSMPAIRDWLRAHPTQARAIMDHNESYVFFKKRSGEALGNIEVLLTPGRSVALDHRLFPKGALAWLETRKPLTSQGQVKGWGRLARFVLVQDTGGAITGPGRLDLFFGAGLDAEAGAGVMKEMGRLFFLVLKK